MLKLHHSPSAPCRHLRLGWWAIILVATHISWCQWRRDHPRSTASWPDHWRQAAPKPGGELACSCLPPRRRHLRAVQMRGRGGGGCRRRRSRHPAPGEGGKALVAGGAFGRFYAVRSVQKGLRGEEMRVHEDQIQPQRRHTSSKTHCTATTAGRRAWTFDGCVRWSTPPWSVPGLRYPSRNIAAASGPSSTWRYVSKVDERR